MRGHQLEAPVAHSATITRCHTNDSLLASALNKIVVQVEDVRNPKCRKSCFSAAAYVAVETLQRQPYTRVSTAPQPSQSLWGERWHTHRVLTASSAPGANRPSPVGHSSRSATACGWMSTLAPCSPRLAWQNSPLDYSPDARECPPSASKIRRVRSETGYIAVTIPTVAVRDAMAAYEAGVAQGSGFMASTKKGAGTPSSPLASLVRLTRGLRARHVIRRPAQRG